MIYRAIGLMSGSSLDGLDIIFTELTENGGTWSFEILASDCYPYNEEWKAKLQGAIQLNAFDYQLLHTEYGHYLGEQVNLFIDEHNLHFRVGLISSHGHTTFHVPGQKMTAQLGDGAAIAAKTGLPVVSDLRALDVAFGGQGAPIVPIGEKLLLNDYSLFLNIGGIANISVMQPQGYVAFDVCPANRVLNMLVAPTGAQYDEGGKTAASGSVNEALLQLLNSQDYYKSPFPKSLANSFGTDVIYPLVQSRNLSLSDALCTYIEHIAMQVKGAVDAAGAPSGKKLLVTGGGALNHFLVERLQFHLQSIGIEVVVPHSHLINYKEALVMALIGVLRWRQEYNVLCSVTGAERNSIGGALWIGQEA